MSDIEQARLAFIAKAPYLVTNLNRFVYCEAEWVPTCAITTGMVIIYNPSYLAQLNDLQAATRLWHEAGHWQRLTFLRAFTLEGVENISKRSNIASDLGINSSGLEGGWDFGPDGLLPEQYGFPNHLTYEEYFALLPEYASTPEGKTWGGQCGSGAGNPVDLEKELALDEAFGRSKVEQEIIAQQVADDVRRYAARGAGSIPGNLVDWANALLITPQIPWSVVLSNTIAQVAGQILAGVDEYSYARPNRRNGIMPPGPILPGGIEVELEVCVVIDTSGSMDLHEQIEPALAETISVIRSLGLSHIWFLQVDASDACKPARVRAEDLHKIQIHGRGGTDFRPAFETAKVLRPKPSILIYMTDGMGPAPATPPHGMETVWCIFGKCQKPANWGKEVRVG